MSVPRVGSRVLFTLAEGPSEGQDRPGVIVSFREDGRASVTVFVEPGDVVHAQTFITTSRVIARQCPRNKATPGAWRLDPSETE